MAIGRRNNLSKVVTSLYRGRRKIPTAMIVVVIPLALAAGCAPSSIIGPLSHQQEERAHLLTRARKAGLSTNLLEKVAPPLTPDEEKLASEQDSSCRSSYVEKNAFIWTGGGLVAASAGLTIAGAFVTTIDTANDRLIFGIGAGTMAAVGSGLAAVGTIIQQRFIDRGCTSKVTEK